jgi:hypothetical protein
MDDENEEIPVFDRSEDAARRLDQYRARYKRAQDFAVWIKNEGAARVYWQSFVAVTVPSEVLEVLEAIFEGYRPIGGSRLAVTGEIGHSPDLHTVEDARRAGEAIRRVLREWKKDVPDPSFP